MKRTLFVAVILCLAVLAAGATVRRVFFNDDVVATGYLQPTETTELNFASASPVTEVLVGVGDVVRAGQVLAKQDTTALEAELAAHESALAMLLSTAPATDAVDAAARAQLGAAQAKAVETLRTDDATVLAAAANVDAARATLATDQAQIDQYASACSAASDARAAEGNSGAGPPITAPAPSPVLINTCSQLAHRISQDEANLSRAVSAYDEAVTRRESNAATQNASVIAAANEVEASNSRAALSAGSSAGIVAQHAAAVAATRAALNTAVLIAPHDGVIGSVGGAPGEIAGPEGVRVFGTANPLPEKQGTGIQLFPQPAQQPSQSESQFLSMITLNTSTVKVVAQVNEEDLESVTSRQRATVTFPALPDESFSGAVARIEPQAVNTDGAVSFLVEIELAEQPSTAYRVRRGGQGSSTFQLFGLTANVRM